MCGIIPVLSFFRLPCLRCNSSETSGFDKGRRAGFSCAAALAALNVLEEEPELPERLLRLSDFFREALKQRGMSIRESRTPIVPIFTYTADRTLRIAMELYKQGLFVNTVLPPAAPADGCMLRTSLMATLTESLLEEAADILSRVFSMPEYAMK